MKTNFFSAPIEKLLTRSDINTAIEKGAAKAHQEIKEMVEKTCNKLEIEVPPYPSHGVAPEGLKIGKYTFKRKGEPPLATDVYISRTTPCLVSDGAGWKEQIHQAHVKFRTPDGLDVLSSTILAEDQPYRIISYGVSNFMNPSRAIQDQAQSSTRGIRLEQIEGATKMLLDKISKQDI
ncbi:MAG TPA: hypothetical protein V6C52_04995 [Coleofasciculaceae cyanobacterium]|jgi:hypothetical protein